MEDPPPAWHDNVMDGSGARPSRWRSVLVWKFSYFFLVLLCFCFFLFMYLFCISGCFMCHLDPFSVFCTKKIVSFSTSLCFHTSGHFTPFGACSTKEFTQKVVTEMFSFSLFFSQVLFPQNLFLHFCFISHFWMFYAIWTTFQRLLKVFAQERCFSPSCFAFSGYFASFGASSTKEFTDSSHRILCLWKQNFQFTFPNFLTPSWWSIKDNSSKKISVDWSILHEVFKTLVPNFNFWFWFVASCAAMVFSCSDGHEQCESCMPGQMGQCSVP